VAKLLGERLRHHRGRPRDPDPAVGDAREIDPLRVDRHPGRGVGQRPLDGLDAARPPEAKPEAGSDDREPFAVGERLPGPGHQLDIRPVAVQKDDGTDPLARGVVGLIQIIMPAIGATAPG